MHITKLIILSYYFKCKTKNPHKCTYEKKKLKENTNML